MGITRRVFEVFVKPEIFNAIKEKDLNFIVVPNDKGYQRGDVLRIYKSLNGFNSEFITTYNNEYEYLSNEKIKADQISMDITYVWSSSYQYGLLPEYVALNIKNEMGCENIS